MVADPLKSIPANHVMAVITDQAAAHAALDALRQQGFADAILFEGEEIAEQIDPNGEHAGLVEKAVKAIGDHLSEESGYMAQYQEEARNGNRVISVPIAGRDESAPVQELLEKHGASNIRFFGRLAVTDLTPDSNPSSRSV
jgi:hypothetical protein